MHAFRLTGSYAFVIFMVASVFRHIKTGPLRGGVQCQAAWSNFLYINNFIWDYKPTLQEAQETYGASGVRNPYLATYAFQKLSLNQLNSISVSWPILVPGQ